MNTLPDTNPPAAWNGRRSLVLFDGFCPFCQASTRLLKAFDWLGNLEFRSLRDRDNIPATQPPLELSRLIEEMHVVTPHAGRTYHGFWAFRHIAWRLPALVLVAPILYIPGVGWLGQKAYMWIARNRFGLVPCKDGVCTIPSAGNNTPR